MPVKAAEMLDMLGVKPSRRKLALAMWGMDDNYGPRKRGKPVRHIFPREATGKIEQAESMEELKKRKQAEKEAQRQKRKQELAAAAEAPVAEVPASESTS